MTTTEKSSAVLAAMRAEVIGEDGVFYTMDGRKVLEYLDRIEAAGKREFKAIMPKCADGLRGIPDCNGCLADCVVLRRKLREQVSINEGHDGQPVVVNDIPTDNSTKTQKDGVLSFEEVDGLFAGLIRDMRGPIPKHKTDKELLDRFSRRAVDVWSEVRGHLRNVYRMREALEAVALQESADRADGIDRDAMCGRCLHAKIMFNDCKHDGSCWVDKVVNALAAPTRNVDRFATMDEAREAFQTMRGHWCRADVELWDSRDEIGEFVRWLFALATPVKGGEG